MPRSACLSRTSRPRTTSPSGPSAFLRRSSSLTLAAAAAVALSLAASPALARTKKKTDEPAPAAAEPAKPTGPVAPPADSLGRVHFGPEGEGQGKVTVKSTNGEKVQVFLEGRYFGDTPITIWSVPKGDYIVEGTFPDGQQKSRPVNVSEGDEATVDLAAGKIETPGTAKGGFMGGEISPNRLRLAKGLLIGGGVFLAAGAVFGILKIMKENDYKNAPNDQATLDSIANDGKRDALLANIGFVTGGLLIIGAGVAALPMFMKSNPEKAPTMAFVVAPGTTAHSGSAIFTLRF
jgi:hypothetical protein